MKMKSRVLAGIILLAIFGGIALTTALGWWETANLRTPGGAGKNSSVESGHSNEETHEETGGDHSSSAFINGQTTFWQVREAGVSEERIAEILGSEMPNTAMTVKDYCLQNDLPFSTIKKALQAEMEAE